MIPDYELGQTVTIKCSGEKGIVIAKAQYLESSDCVLLRYKCADGRAVESWWNVQAVEG